MIAKFNTIIMGDFLPIFPGLGHLAWLFTSAGSLVRNGPGWAFLSGLLSGHWLGSLQAFGLWASPVPLPPWPPLANKAPQAGVCPSPWGHLPVSTLSLRALAGMESMSCSISFLLDQSAAPSPSFQPLSGFAVGSPPYLFCSACWNRCSLVRKSRRPLNLLPRTAPPFLSRWRATLP